MLELIVGAVLSGASFMGGVYIGITGERVRRKKEDEQQLDAALEGLRMYRKGQASMSLKADIYEDPATWGQA